MTKVKHKVDVEVGVLQPPEKGHLLLLLILILLCKYRHFSTQCSPSSFTFLQIKLSRIHTVPCVELEQCFGGCRGCVKLSGKLWWNVSFLWSFCYLSRMKQVLFWSFVLTVDFCWVI